MGLYRRPQGKVWWMNFMYQWRQVRRSTGTADRRLAEKILGKVGAQIVEGRFFETLEETTRTFDELMARYLSEHAARTSQPRRYRGYAYSLTAFFGGRTLAEITPKMIVEYKNWRYAAGLNADRIGAFAPSIPVCVEQGQDRRFSFPRSPAYLCDETRSSRRGHLQSPTAARA